MRWTEMDHDKKLWTVPGARTKNHREHVVPLPDSALALIAASPRRTDRDYVFGNGPRRNGDGHRGFSGWSKAKVTHDERIVEARNKAAKIKPPLDWRLHDLRRTVATVMADRLGVLPHIIEAILNHVSGHRAGVAEKHLAKLEQGSDADAN
jgi:integrase